MGASEEEHVKQARRSACFYSIMTFTIDFFPRSPTPLNRYSTLQMQLNPALPCRVTYTISVRSLDYFHVFSPFQPSSPPFDVFAIFSSVTSGERLSPQRISKVPRVPLVKFP
jgi:hypothetical protein